MTTIIDACRDPKLFRPWFRDPTTWRAWFVFLRALFALPMTEDEVAIYRQLTGREAPPTEPSTEAWLVVGRRGGKSFIVALIAVFLACFRDYLQHLAPGERGVVMVLACDRRQARVIFRYALALLEGVPMLRALIERTTAEGIDLTNGISIEIHTASFRSTRGYTVVAALCDEIAFWRSDESANPDREILDALRPAMATIPGALLLGLGTPYRRSGVLYEAHRDHYGHDGDRVLVIQADTRALNPTVPQRVIDDAYERDPVAAEAEYNATFRSDIAGFLDAAWIETAVVPGRHELPPLDGLRYFAFTDPSGGRHDAFTLAIAHQDPEGKTVLDLCRGERPPFNPTKVVEAFAALLKEFRLTAVTGDRYGGEWVVRSFSEFGIHYQASKLSKSELFLETAPMLARGVVELLDNQKMLTELRQLERKTRSGGRDVVDHPPRGHDDLANVCAGALWLAGGRRVAEPSIRSLASDNPVVRRGILGTPYGGGSFDEWIRGG